MSSGFSGGVSDFFSADGRPATGGANINQQQQQQQQFSLRSPLSKVVPDPAAQIRRPDLIGKRSLAEFQNQQGGLGLGFYLRNVKSRPNYHLESPLSAVDLSSVPYISPRIPSVSSSSSSSISSSLNPRYGLPVLQPNRVHHFNRSISNGSSVDLSQNTAANTDTSFWCMESEGLAQKSEKKTMNHRLQELEKELLGDEDDVEAVSVVTNSEWSETIQNLISPAQKPVSLSPTSSSSSSCSSTSASPPITCAKQHLIDAAAAISEGKFEISSEILARLQQVANHRGTPEQRLTAYMVAALKSRVSSNTHQLAVAELFGDEHNLSIQKLYDVSPCFKLGFMAANLAVLEVTAERGFQKIHVLDFDLGQGRQYVHLLYAMAEKNSGDGRAPWLRITTFTDFSAAGEDKHRIIGEDLKLHANRIGVSLSFSVMNFNATELSRENLRIDPSEAVAVNLAFKLHKLPDESVTTENLRDDLLRRVRGLSPTVITVVEEEMNCNTASLTVRVREACDHYGALLESLEATVPRESSDRVRIEEAIGRKLGNSVACEGRERVERSEMYGKWRARMGMAGFRAVPVSQAVAESLRFKLNSGTRVNPGFTVRQQSGSLCFGWMSRILTVASAWC